MTPPSEPSVLSQPSHCVRIRAQFVLTCSHYRKLLRDRNHMLSMLATTVTPLTSSLCTESGAYCVRPLTGDLCIDSPGYCDWLYKTGFASPIRHGASHVYTQAITTNISPLYQLDLFDWTVLIIYFGILTVLAIYGVYRVKQVIDFWRYSRFPPKPKGEFAEAELPHCTVQPQSCNGIT